MPKWCKTVRKRFDKGLTFYRQKPDVCLWGKSRQEKPDEIIWRIVGGGWQRRRPEPDANTAKINFLFINLSQIALVGVTLIEFEKLCASLEVPGPVWRARASKGVPKLV